MNSKKHSGAEWLYIGGYHIIIIASIVMTLYPLLVVFSSSVSSPVAVGRGEVLLFPKEFTLKAYGYVMRNKDIWIGYGNTLLYTIVGTTLSLITTACAGYALSKKRLRGKGIVTFFFAFTMWFEGGIIPTYLLIKDVGLLDNRWAMIMPGLMSVFYMILLRTYFSSVPEALEESAKLDGANDLYIMVKIYLPLSIPAMVTIGLYYAVNKWNAWFHAMLYLSDEKKYPLQLFLRRILTQARLTDEEMLAVKTTQTVSAETIQYATIVVAIIPMLLIYPFIQKYFEKGIMVGSVKG